MGNPEDNQVMTVAQVAEFLQISPTKVYRCLNTGEIPGKKIGGQWRIWRPALEEYIGRPATPPPAMDQPMGGAVLPGG